MPFNDIEALKNAVNDKTCAVVLEPVQGEGGILPADLEYLKQVRALCDEKGILLLFDEVQCGMGRIGTRFAWQSFGVEPDAFSMAKAIANGLPMGGFITKRKYADTLTPGTHASTFGGTALVSAAALAVQEAFDNEGVLENCREQGEYLRRQLGELGKKYPFVKGVRGMGLMIGVVLDREAATLAGLCLKRNLVVLTAGETVLRLLPPLNLTRAEADEGIGKIAARSRRAECRHTGGITDEEGPFDAPGHHPERSGTYFRTRVEAQGRTRQNRVHAAGRQERRADFREILDPDPGLVRSRRRRARRPPALSRSEQDADRPRRDGGGHGQSAEPLPARHRDPDLLTRRSRRAGARSGHSGHQCADRRIPSVPDSGRLAHHPGVFRAAPTGRAEWRSTATRAATSRIR